MPLSHNVGPVTSDQIGTTLGMLATQVRRWRLRWQKVQGRTVSSDDGLPRPRLGRA